MPDLIANGIRHHYLKAGKAGDPVVLIHGFTGSHATWFSQVPALATDYRVFAYDARGHGDSEHPAEGHDLATLGKDLDAFLSALAIAKAHLVGLSMGGMIVQQFGLAHPDRALSLTVADSFPGRPDPEVLRLFRRHEELARGQGLKALFAELLVHPALPVGPDFKVPLQFIKAYEDVFLKNDLATMTAFVNMFHRMTDWTGDLSLLKPPTLLIVGDHDTPCLAPMRKMQALIPAADFALLPRCGHSSPLEKPDLFNQALLKFLGRNRFEACLW